MQRYCGLAAVDLILRRLDGSSVRTPELRFFALHSETGKYILGSIVLVGNKINFSVGGATMNPHELGVKRGTRIAEIRIRFLCLEHFVQRLTPVNFTFAISVFGDTLPICRPPKIICDRAYFIIGCRKSTQGQQWHRITKKSAAITRYGTVRTWLGTANNFQVDHTEDATAFRDDILSHYDVVIWLSTTSDVLNDTQQAAFERYIRGGGGYVGVHSATDTEYDWPWYGQLVGAYFKRHPQIQDARVDVRDRSFIATRCLPAVWNRRDEWYDFRAAPPADAKILLTLDEKSYQGGTMGDFHPLSWYHQVDGGRAFYTELGHTSESYTDPLYLEHLLGGILWAATR